MKYLIHIFIFILCFDLLAEDRWISLDWDEVKGASSYEIELFEKVDNEYLSRGVSKVMTARWSKAVTPGLYSLKLRTLDRRGVAGAWSQLIPLSIKLPTAQLLSPRPNEMIELPENQEYEFNFQWSEVSGAKYYRFNLYEENQNKYYSTILDKTELKFLIHDRQKYFWEVIPLYTKEESTPDKISLKSFSVLGAQLPAPDIKVEKINNEVIISWQNIKNADSYKYTISKIEESGDTQELLKGQTSQTRIIFNKSKFGVGTYTATIYATGKAYKPSLPSDVIYKYDKEIIEIVKKEVQIISVSETTERLGRYIKFDFSQLNITYIYKNYELDTQSNQKLSGIQAQAEFHTNVERFRPYNKTWQNQTGLKYISASDTKSKVSWINLSSTLGTDFNFKIKNLNFLLEPYLGIFAQKTPLITTNRLKSSFIQTDDIISLGPLAGFHFSYKFNPWWKAELQSSLALHMLYPKTPDSRVFSSGLGSTLSPRVIYYFKSNFDFFVGFNLYSEQLIFKPKTTTTSLATSGDNNQLNYSSSYFNVGVNWYF